MVPSSCSRQRVYLVMLKEYDKHYKVIHTLNSTTDTYFDQGSYLPSGEGNAGMLASGRHL